MVIWHEESFHTGVHVEPHMLPEGIGQSQQQGSLGLAATHTRSLLVDTTGNRSVSGSLQCTHFI